MDNVRTRLADVLREHMRSSLVDTQVKVAARAGVSQSTVQRILAAEQATTLDVIEQLAHAFGIQSPPHFLLDRDERKLLSMWESLGPDDRAAVLGFMQMKITLQGDDKTPLSKLTSASQLDYESGTPVPAGLQAAIKRASGRTAGSEKSDESQNPTHIKKRKV